MSSVVGATRSSTATTSTIVDLTLTTAKCCQSERESRLPASHSRISTRSTAADVDDRIRVYGILQSLVLPADGIDSYDETTEFESGRIEVEDDDDTAGLE